MVEVVLSLLAIVLVIGFFLAFIAFQDATTKKLQTHRDTLAAKYPAPTHELDKQMATLSAEVKELKSEINNLKMQNSFKDNNR